MIISTYSCILRNTSHLYGYLQQVQSTEVLSSLTLSFTRSISPHSSPSSVNFRQHGRPQHAARNDSWRCQERIYKKKKIYIKKKGREREILPCLFLPSGAALTNAPVETPGNAAARPLLQCPDPVNPCNGNGQWTSQARTGRCRLQIADCRCTPVGHVPGGRNHFSK